MTTAHPPSKWVGVLEELRSYAFKGDSRYQLAPTKTNPQVQRYHRTAPVAKSEFDSHQGRHFKDFFSRITQTEGFGQHIDRSIPGYATHRAALAMGVAAQFPKGHTLDVGASEGQWGRAIHHLAPEHTVVHLDPNPDMLTNNVHEEGEKVAAAWHEGWTEDDGTEVPAYQSKKPADVVGMHMVRQFVTTDTDGWYGEVKKHLKPGGLFLYSAKVSPEPHPEGQEEWDHQERRKDKYKSKSFSKEAMTAKAAEVIEGMRRLQIPHSVEMEALHKHFEHVEPIWESHNFRGYVASDHPEAAKRFADTYRATKKEVE